MSYRIVNGILTFLDKDIPDFAVLNTKTASEYFKINRTNIACVLSEKNKAKQFYVGDNRYDVQKLPKTRDWNFDIPYVKRNQL